MSCRQGGVSIGMRNEILCQILPKLFEDCVDNLVLNPIAQGEYSLIIIGTALYKISNVSKTVNLD